MVASTTPLPWCLSDLRSFLLMSPWSTEQPKLFLSIGSSARSQAQHIVNIANDASAWRSWVDTMADVAHPATPSRSCAFTKKPLVLVQGVTSCSGHGASLGDITVDSFVTKSNGGFQMKFTRNRKEVFLNRMNILCGFLEGPLSPFKACILAEIHPNVR